MTQKQTRKPTRRDLLKWMAAGAASSLVPITLGSVSTGWISVEKYEIELPKWDANGFRIAVMADLHTNSPVEVQHAINAIRLAIDEKPDLIALPGDFVNFGDTRHLNYVQQALEALHEAKCPVVATLGNHDYDCRDVNGVISAVQTSPAKVLRNQSIEVQGVTVGGVDDAIARRHRPGFLADASLSKSLIALFHEPDFVDSMPKQVSLQLSGHSHGGQICLPGGRPLHTPRGAWNYYAGFYSDAKVPLFVTRGVGTVGPRLRIFCRPEVSILTLRSA